MTPLALALALSAPGQPLPVYPPPAPPVLIAPAPVAVTLAEFARGFVPVPGPQEAWVIHPRTGCPVRVCFTLPDCGPPTKVEVHPRRFVVEYRKHAVRVIFRLNGSVDVKYD